nr:MAG TPA: hypothetical protein [Caudoviricetes sp.]
MIKHLILGFPYFHNLFYSNHIIAGKILQLNERGTNKQ